MSAGGDHADADVKSVEEILKSEGNDELKFGLLASLIKIGQVSTKDVVNTVLHLVSWVFKNIAALMLQPVMVILYLPVKFLDQ